MGVPLANTWECRGCGTSNTVESCFCKSCGLAVHDTDIDPRLRALDEVFRKKREDLLSLSVDLTDRIEMESRKRIDTMIKTGGIIGFGGIIFGLFSYLIPLDKMFGDIDKRATEATKKIAELEDRIKASQARLGENEAVLKKVRDTEERVTQTEIRTTALSKNAETKTKDMTRQASDVLRKAQMAENANYELFIYADPGVSGSKQTDHTKVSDTTIHAIEKLNRAGYRVGNGDVAPVQVDRNQVVYYSELNRQKAEDLRSLLQEFYDDIEISFKRNSDNGVRTLLLKLRDRPR